MTGYAFGRDRNTFDDLVVVIADGPDAAIKSVGTSGIILACDVDGHYVREKVIDGVIRGDA
ncbi:hypothetical protein AAE478_005135 [Parahypoxylon ruwenzoriense]